MSILIERLRHETTDVLFIRPQQFRIAEFLIELDRPRSVPVAADQCHAFGINRAGDADTVFHFVRNRPLHRPVFRRDPVNVLGSPADELLGALTLDEQWRAVACSGVQWRAVACSSRRDHHCCARFLFRKRRRIPLACGRRATPVWPFCEADPGEGRCGNAQEP